MSRSKSPKHPQDAQTQDENNELQRSLDGMAFDPKAANKAINPENAKKTDDHKNGRGRGQRRSTSRSFDSGPRNNRSRSGSRHSRHSRRSRSRSDRSRPRNQDNEEFVQVYVAGISRSTTSEELKEFFEAHGAILDINMKGHYAFITFELPKAAAAAVQALHGK